jgi:hypothetical protein
MKMRCLICILKSENAPWLPVAIKTFAISNGKGRTAYGIALWPGHERPLTLVFFSCICAEIIITIYIMLPSCIGRRYREPVAAMG